MNTIEQVESEIERRFLQIAAPQMCVELEPQVELRTRGGNYRGDFIGRGAGRAVLIECDGRKFHDFAEDRVRDTNILSDTFITDIIRLRGCDIYFDGENAVGWVRKLAPFLFDAEAAPLDGEGMLLNGSLMGMGIIKPIWRVRAELTQADLAKMMQNQCFSYFGRREGQPIVQWKSPLWDWRYRGEGVAMSIGDVFSMFGVPESD